MKINKSSLSKSVWIPIVLATLGIICLHVSPSSGHGPLRWDELFNNWWLHLFPLALSVILFYILIEEWHEDSDNNHT